MLGDKAQNLRPTANVAFLTSKANPLPIQVSTAPLSNVPPFF